MKSKFISIFSIILLIILGTTPAAAGGAVKLSSVTFSLGSLIATGYVSGLGKTDVTVVLDATGSAATICTNFGSNDVPGQSYPKVSAVGRQDLSGNQERTKNGKTLFDRVETVDPIVVAWDAAGCPNANWTGRIAAIYWTDATISVKNTLTGQVLTSQKYICNPALQTATTVSCSPTK